MPSTDQTIASGGLSGRHFTDSYVTMRVTYADDNGTEIDADGPSVSITLGGTPVVVEVMEPLKKYLSETGVYTYKFLTDGLVEGDYAVEFSGNNPNDGSPLPAISGAFSLTALARRQHLINRVQRRLANVDPAKFEIEVSTQLLWEDGEINDTLEDLIERVNMQPPQTPGLFNLTNFRDGDLLISGAILYCLMSRGLLEIAREMQYSDELALNLNKSPKYQASARDLQNAWEQRLTLFKQAYAFHNFRPIALKRLRFPLRMYRPLSLAVPNSESLFERLMIF